MKIGVMINVHRGMNILEELEKVRSLDLESCQISIWEPALFTDELAAEINAAVAATGITVSTENSLTTESGGVEELVQSLEEVQNQGTIQLNRLDLVAAQHLPV